ncbi:type IV toxin-antitoxin system AbiEi family antitoxin domain-containing protein [Nocardioides sp. NPDC126508]
MLDRMDIEMMRYAGALGSDFPLPPTLPFTTKMAREAGITDRQLRELVRLGLLRRPLKGLYVANDVTDSLELRVACLKLVVPPDAVVVDRHAGWLHGAEMMLAPGEHLEIQPLSLFLPAGRGRLKNDLASSGERTFRDDDVVEIDGLLVTTPLRTALDVGRVRWPQRAIAGVDQMHRLKAYDPDEFLGEIERFRGHRYVTTLRLVGPLADGRAESPPESVLRLESTEVRGLDLVPQLDVYRGARLLGRLDLGNETLRIGVEYDGEEWHSSPEQLEHDRTRRAEMIDDGWLIEAFRKEDTFARLADPGRRLRALRDQAHRRLRSGDAAA